MTTTETAPKLPKGLTFTVSPAEGNTLYTEATVMVGWNPIGETGGPLRFVFHDNAIVVLSSDKRGENNGFYLRGVPYNLRVDLLRQPDGSFAPKPGYDGRLRASRRDRILGDDASRPALRDLEAIVLEVARQVIDQHRNLVLRGSVKSLQAAVERAERKVEEQQVELHAAQEALREAREQLHVASWAEMTDR